MMNKLYEMYKPFIELKNLLRTGWTKWVKSGIRTESVGSHIAGTCGLACLMWTTREEYRNLDIGKVVRMLAIHETGELKIGDITPFDKNKDKAVKATEREQASKMLCDFKSKDELLKLLDEFARHETAESKFCYDIDKLDCVLQSEIYTRRGQTIPYNSFIKKTKQTLGFKLNQFEDCYDAHYNFWKAKAFDKSLFDLTQEEKIFVETLYRLKELPRTGWVDKAVSDSETVAEHVCGTFYLAEVVNDACEFKFNMNQVCLMLALHEMGECVGGDMTPFDVGYENKLEMEGKEVAKLCELIPNGDKLFAIWEEFECKKTKEAEFCYLMDKLEAVFMGKYYNEAGKLKNKDLKEFIDTFVKKKKLPANYIGGIL